MIDPLLRKDIQLAESCKLIAYQDSLGVWTIGWGHADVPPGTVWTQDQADGQLDRDIESATFFAGRLWEWPALDTACRRNAVIELCFNMRGKWLKFVDTRAAIHAKDWQGAHDGLLNSLWAKQVHAARADRLANYLLKGTYEGGSNGS